MEAGCTEGLMFPLPCTLCHHYHQGKGVVKMLVNQNEDILQLICITVNDSTRLGAVENWAHGPSSPQHRLAS